MDIEFDDKSRGMPMPRDYKRIQFGAVILMAALAICGCGELGVADVDEKPLKLVGLYPQTGEEVSAQDLMVVAVFSETVGFGSAGTDVNETTFYLEDDSGMAVDGITVTESEPDPQDATALLMLPDPTPLDSGETYWVVLKSSIQGPPGRPCGTPTQAERSSRFFSISVDFCPPRR
jgi:hypothetical protein